MFSFTPMSIKEGSRWSIKLVIRDSIGSDFSESISISLSELSDESHQLLVFSEMKKRGEED